MRAAWKIAFLPFKILAWGVGFLLLGWGLHSIFARGNKQGDGSC